MTTGDYNNFSVYLQRYGFSITTVLVADICFASSQSANMCAAQSRSFRGNSNTTHFLFRQVQGSIQAGQSADRIQSAQFLSGRVDPRSLGGFGGRVHAAHLLSVTATRTEDGGLIPGASAED
jgi:hypothetical protein